MALHGDAPGAGPRAGRDRVESSGALMTPEGHGGPRHWRQSPTDASAASGAFDYGANDETNDADVDTHVHLQTTWGIAALRHPSYRLVTCLVRWLGAFVLCGTSPSLAATAAASSWPRAFPVYGEWVGLWAAPVVDDHDNDDVVWPRVLLHALLLAVAVVFVRLVVYRLGAEDAWNWGRQQQHARRRFTQFSRSSLAAHAPTSTQRGHDTDAHADADADARRETTIALWVYASGTSEAPDAVVDVHTRPTAQGSWTLLAALVPGLWLAQSRLLQAVVRGTTHERTLFGALASSRPSPWGQWRVELLVFDVLMLLHGLSTLLVLDQLLQDRVYARRLYGNWCVGLRRQYTRHQRLRLVSCWTLALIHILGGVILGGWYRRALLGWLGWCLDSGGSRVLANESWRAFLSGLLVGLDLLWVLQDWHFPSFATPKGTRIFGLPVDVLALGSRRIRVHLTSAWARGFVGLGLLLPLDLCQFLHVLWYEPGAYAQDADPAKGRRVRTKTSSSSSLTSSTAVAIPPIIARLADEGSMSRYFDWPVLDRAPAVVVVGLVVGFLVWLAQREGWRLKYAAFLGRAQQRETRDEVNRTLPAATRKTLKEQIRLRRLYHLRSHVDRACCALVGVSVLTVILQVRCLWRLDKRQHRHDGAGDDHALFPRHDTGPLATPGETFGVLLSLLSLGMVVVLAVRYALKAEILMLRNEIPRDAGPTSGWWLWWWHRRPRTKLLLPFLGEALVSGLCLPPLVHGTVSMREIRFSVGVPVRDAASTAGGGPQECPPRMVQVPDSSEPSRAQCALEYAYPVEVLNLCVLLRLYWFVRLVRNELVRRLFADRSALLLQGGLGRDLLRDLSSIRWSFRMCFALLPGRMVCGLFVCLWAGTAAAVSILERPFPSLLDNEEHSLWLTIVTMSSVGYGDAYPLTAWGRLAVFFGAVLGGAVLVSLMMTIFLDALKGSKDEHRLVTTIEMLAWERHRQNLAASLIAAAWRTQTTRSREGPTGSTAVKLFQQAHRFKVERKRGRPRDSSESQEQRQISHISKWRREQLTPWLAATHQRHQELVLLLENEVTNLENAMTRLF